MANQKSTAEQKAAPAVENNDCFIIMPIADHADYKAGHFKRVYQDIFAPACKAAGYNPVRADDVAQTNLIQLDILQKLLESPMAICDLSTRNPNVLFELGLRQAFDKPTILVQEVGTPAIFDISMFRYTTYNKALDYREVLSDQQNIQRVLEETKNAVNNGKNVNSIVKLLSISQPAKLEDISKFGEKEYFDVLLNAINGLKKDVRNIEKKQIHGNDYSHLLTSTKFDDNYLSYYGLMFSPDNDLNSIKKFYEFLTTVAHLKDLSLKAYDDDRVEITFHTRYDGLDNDLSNLVNGFGLNLIIIDRFPF